jgi:predicted phage tail component-like protein
MAWSIITGEYPHLTFRQPQKWEGFIPPYQRKGWGILTRINDGYPHLYWQYYDLPEEEDILGFIFKTQDTENFGWLVVRSINRQLLPSQRSSEITVPGIHGTIDFNKGDLDNRVIEIEGHILADNLTQLRARCREIAKWLYTETHQPLIFKDEIDKKYLAKIYSAVNLQQIGTNAVFNVNFVCKPIAEAVIPVTIVGVISGSGIIEITLGANKGTFETRPTISLTTTSTINGEINIYADGLFDLKYTIPTGEPLQAGETIVINSEDFTVIRNGNINDLKRVDGNFPFIPTGVEFNIGITNFYGSYQLEIINKYL